MCTTLSTFSKGKKEAYTDSTRVLEESTYEQ